MAWRKPSTELSALLGQVLAPYRCQQQKMFGCPVYTVNGNLFAGVHQEVVFVRLSRGDREALLSSSDEVQPFEPMPGRPMKEYLALPDSVCGDGAALTEWLELAYRYAESLPARIPRKR